MARSSRNVIGTLNIVTMLLSVPVIGTGIWLALEAKTSCVKILLKWPVIMLGILILLVALAGVVGGFRGIQALVVMYYFGMIIGIMLLTSLVCFLYGVTAIHYKDPPLYAKNENVRDFSNFLAITSLARYTTNTTTCLQSSRMCADLSQTNSHTAQDSVLTKIQSGCCTLPKRCNDASRGTYPRPRLYFSDCYLWSNDQNTLCYNCMSCQVGLLYRLNAQYRRANLILIITLVALIIVYLAGCFALKKANLEDLFS